MSEIQENLNSIGLKLSAEEFSEQDFQKYHLFSDSDEKILRRLIVPGPVLLRGPRGSGKSAYMRKAHKILESSRSTIISSYISLRFFPLITAKSEDYLSILVPYVARHIAEAFSEAGLESGEIVATSTVDEFNTTLASLCLRSEKRLVIFFDDVAHIGREVSLAGFFDFFRTISSSLVSCKASIYPGVTKFGSRFDLYSDATIVEAQRDERSPDFSKFFSELLAIRYPELLNRCENRLKDVIPLLLGRAVLGNVRAFTTFCEYLQESSSKITTHAVADGLKWLASGYLYPALDELQTKLGAYAPMLTTAETISTVFFEDCGKKKVNSMLIHRDHVQRLGKIFEILEYSGLIAKREASRALAKSGSGRGARYALSLGPLFEKIPGGTLSYELIEELTRTSVLNEQMIEYAPISVMMNFECPSPENEKDLDILDLPIEKLAVSKILPYGLTPAVLESLDGQGYKKISDIASLSTKKLKEIPNIGDAKAQRIKNAVDQAIWM